MNKLRVHYGYKEASIATRVIKITRTRMHMRDGKIVKKCLCAAILWSQPLGGRIGSLFCLLVLFSVCLVMNSVNLGRKIF